MDYVVLQLPALICPGITLVISPLVSLIQDQIMHLLQVMLSVLGTCPAFSFIFSIYCSLSNICILHFGSCQANIPATYLSANMEWAEQQEILRELNSEYCKYKLLYVTPEKIAKWAFLTSCSSLQDIFFSSSIYFYDYFMENDYFVTDLLNWQLAILSFELKSKLGTSIGSLLTRQSALVKYYYTWCLW